MQGNDVGNNSESPLWLRADAGLVALGSNSYHKNRHSGHRGNESNST